MLHQGSSDASARRARRAGWTVTRTPLDGQSPADHYPSPAAALRAMWQLTLDAWALTGNPLPSHTRAETPLRRRTLDPRAARDTE